MATAASPKPPLRLSMTSSREYAATAMAGIIGLLLILALLLGGLALVVVAVAAGSAWFGALGFLLVVLGLLSWNGMIILQPNTAAVLVFFGRYRGTAKTAGWYFVNPLTWKRRISLRVRNFNSPQLKVNDAAGNPIDIAAVVVWRVVDTARAVFDVEDYAQFVEVQSETAIRHLASQYPYDHPLQRGQPTLRGAPDEIAEALRVELHQRLTVAGVDVVEARISHLAYAPEIAQAMLQRQQAAAMVAARTEIVTGAVGIVELVLDSLTKRKLVTMTPAQRSDLVSNLLLILASDRGAQPVIPTRVTE